MKMKRIKDIADFDPGQSPQSKHYSESEGIPFIQGNRTFGHLYPFIDTYTNKVTKIAKKGSILISVRAPVGDLNIANEDLCIGRGVGALNSKIGNNEFLYYLMKHNVDNLTMQGSGTTYNAITKDVINDFEVFIPENHEKIGSFLFNFDKIIEMNNLLINWC